MSTDGILEQALLRIKPGREAEFEAAFATAKDIISRMPGFRSLTLSRGIERPDTYLLLVRWNTVGDHEVGFRGSREYQQWRALLHDFYAPFPVVEHFVEVSRVA
ncbi:MAG: antibiotic biosynthesis monooxygenase family protein [Rhodoglobus sp.]